VRRAGLGLLALAAAAGCGGGDPPALVGVTAGRADVATGFVTGPGRVVTVAHVLDGGRAVTVRRRPGGAARPARVLRVDRRLDLALLAVGGVDGPAVRLERDAPEQVRLLGRDVRVRRRIVARVREDRFSPVASRPALELAASVRAGDSGSPVVTEDGAVAGVLFARGRERSRVAYAVDASGVAAFLGRR
jgi:S1-C subfamily serine protease